MALNYTGYALSLDNLTDATDGINYCLVLTNVYSKNYNLVAATITEYNAATNKIDLTVGDTDPSASDVEDAMESQSSSYYADYIGESLTDVTIFKVDDTVGYTYWKAFYPTKKALTFDDATSNDYGGTVEGNNLSLLFDIDGGQTVQAIGIYHAATLIAYEEVTNVTDTNDFQYSVDSVVINIT